MDMAAKTLQTKAEQGFADHYEAAKATLPGAGNPWARALREDAMRAYAASGLPHRRIEEWKYTDLRANLAEAFAPAPALGEALGGGDVDAALGAVAGLDAYRVVVIDGQVRPELSDLEALGQHGEALTLGQALDRPPGWFKTEFGKVNTPDSDPILLLDTALMSGGAVLRIKDGARLDKPLHLVHVHAARHPASLATRHFVSIGSRASATLIESFVSISDGPAQRLTVTELVVGEGAEVDHLKYQHEGASSAHLLSWITRLEARAAYRVLQLSAGAQLSRNQLFLAFAGEGATAQINAACLGRGRQHGDTTLVVDHAVPACESRELFKAVLDDRARAVFQGKVVVRPGAQKTDGKQMAQALLLSEEAEFDSKPELEIYADDVICGHGSTSGQIDDDMLFYLRARGIPEHQARTLLIIAFVAESLDIVADEALRTALVKVVEDWLAAKEV